MPVGVDRNQHPSAESRISFYLSCVHAIKLGVFTAIVLATVSCATRPGSVRKLAGGKVHLVRENVTVNNDIDTAGTTQVLYLGSGGVLVVRNQSAILIDPFFSHQGFGRIGRSLIFGKKGWRTFKPDKKMIGTGVTRIRSLLGDSIHLKAIVVAHSHYDHLMDVPAVSRHFDHTIPVFVNQTGFNICHKVLDSTKVYLLEDRMTTREVVRDPFVVPLPDGLAVQIRPILADHNPHFRHVKFFSGEQPFPSDELSDPLQKTRANLWLEGNTFSFLIDFIKGDGEIDYRLFVQSSSCNPPAGIPPGVLLSRNVDLALLGVVSYHFSPEYPCAQLDALNPGKIVWIHWEDFFRKYIRRPRTVRGTDVAEFFRLACIRQYPETGWLMWPGTTIKFVY